MSHLFPVKLVCLWLVVAFLFVFGGRLRPQCIFVSFFSIAQFAMTWQGCCWRLCSRRQPPREPMAVAAAGACQWWRWQCCWQCHNKVNKNNNNNMTTTQQPTWQRTRQPTRREDKWAAGEKLCSKLCFFLVSRYVSTPGQCYASQTYKCTFFGWERYVLMFLSEKNVPVDTTLGHQINEDLKCVVVHCCHRHRCWQRLRRWRRRLRRRINGALTSGFYVEY